jgi:hypothetical protein
MAKTVAEIDGDSSGLVSALNKGEKALGDMASGGGKKLTDQLKEVADQADIAAGNLINKVGGPSAIAAIGGVGIAFGAAKAVVGAFLDSSEKLFRSYGVEGQKVWEGLEQQMDGVSGAFAKAALGGGDMNQQAERMSQLLGTTASAADAALSPLASVADAFFDIAYWESEATKEANKFDAQIKKAKDASDAAAKQAATEKEKYKQQLQEAATAAGAGDLVAKGKALEKAIEFDKAANVTRQSLAAKYEYQIREEWRKDTTHHNAEQLAWVERQAEAEVQAMKRVVIDGHGELMPILKKHGDEKVINELAILKVGAQNLRDSVAAELDVRRQQQEDLEKFGTAAKTPTRKSSIGGSKPSAEEDPVEKEKRELKEIADLKYANDKQEQQMQLDALKRELDARTAANEARMQGEKNVADFIKQMQDEALAELHARGELTEEEIEERNAAILASTKERLGQELGAFMQSAGKELAAGKLTAKSASDFARTQIANVIMGLGDQAMVKAGVYAADFNPMALAMTAAGVAAYAIGNAMSPTVKPSGTTPATEKFNDGGQPASNNYSFNMRVDSVFADGESVARQFARMQESARQRGLLSQGA